MANIKKINNIIIATPDDFTISHFNITKANRTANGTMVMDLIAKKLTFSIKYDYIQEEDLALILSLISTDELFFTFTYTRNNIEYTKTVYVGEIKYIESITQTGQEVWKNLEFKFIEQ